MSDPSQPPVALPTRGVVVFPGMLRILAAGRPTSVRAVERHVEEGVPLVLDAPKSDVAKAFEKLADLFSSVDAEAPIGKPKGRFGRF